MMRKHPLKVYDRKLPRKINDRAIVNYCPHASYVRTPLSFLNIYTQVESLPLYGVLAAKLFCRPYFLGVRSISFAWPTPCTLLLIDDALNKNSKFVYLRYCISSDSSLLELVRLNKLQGKCCIAEIMGTATTIKPEDKYHGMYIDFWIWFLSSKIHI